MVKRGLLVAVLAVAVYWPALDAPFVFDDLVAIQANPNVENGRCWPYGARALTYCFLGLERTWLGPEPRGYHAVSVLLHAFNALLVFAVALRWLMRDAAVVVAAVFAAHPMQSEAVIYAAQQSELWWSFFGLAAVAVAAWRDEAWAILPAGVLTGLAFWSKESAVVVPLLLVLVRPRWWKAGMAAAALLGVLSLSRLSGAIGPNLPGHMSIQDYAVTSMGTMGRYVRLIALPVGQSADPAAGPDLLFAFLGWMALATLAAVCLFGGRLACGGYAWFLICVLPTASVIPILDPMAEHRVYLGMAGLAFAAASRYTRRDWS